MRATAIGSHILFVTHKYPPSTGGMQKQSFELIKNMKSLSSTETIIFNSRYPIFLFMMIALPWTWIRLIKNPRIEIIHANDTLMALFLSPLLLLKRKKLVATVHGLDIVFRFKPFQWWVRNLLSKFHLLIAVSKETRQECLDRGIDPKRAVFIPNAIDYPKGEQKDPDFISVLEKKVSRSLEGKKILLSVGRPIPRKGFSWFVESIMPKLETASIYVIVGASLKQKKAFATLGRFLPKTFFRLLCQMNGIPMDYSILRSLSEGEKFKDLFVLPGKLTDSELAQIYLHADLFVMPNRHVESDFEGFGLVALEAGVRGLPCLAAEVDGIPSAIQDGANGYLLPPLADRKWSEKIDSLLQKQELAMIGKKFQQNILDQNYSWKKMAEAYMVEFEKLTE